MAVHLLSDVDPVCVSVVKRGANRQRFFLRKAAADEQLLPLPGAAPLVKTADWSAVYCVVAQPGAEEDAGLVGDRDVPDRWASAEEIRKAAHRFMANGGLVTKMHESLAPYGQVVENAVALDDFVVEGQTIRKGSWYVAIQPTEEGRRAIEAGEFTGVSMEGTGVRTRVEKAQLRTAERNRLPASAFALPGRRYPIHDLSHARNALARVAQHGSPDEQRRVRAAVRRRFPQLMAKGLEDLDVEVYPADVALLELLAKGTLEKVPGEQNWIDRLSPATKAAWHRSIVYRAAVHMHTERGMAVGHAIASALNWARHICRTGDVKQWRGPQQVNPKSVAEACAAAALWQTMRAEARSKVAKGSSFDGRNVGAVEGSLVKRIAKAVGLSEEEIAQVEIAKAATFGERMAADKLSDELPKGMDLLRSVIFRSVHDPDVEDPMPLIRSSVSEFADWAEGLLSSREGIAKQAKLIGPEGSTNVPGTPESEESEMAWTDEEKQRIEKLEQRLEAVPSAEDIAKAVKEATAEEPAPTPEDLKKGLEELTGKLADIQKGLEALGEGDSSQGGASGEEDKPSKEKVAKAFETLDLDPELAGILS